MIWVKHLSPYKIAKDLLVLGLSSEWKSVECIQYICYDSLKLYIINPQNIAFLFWTDHYFLSHPAGGSLGSGLSPSVVVEEPLVVGTPPSNAEVPTVVSPSSRYYPQGLQE